MTKCIGCGENIKYPRRKQCNRCYYRARARLIAYNQWEPNRPVDVRDAYIHLMTLRGWNMGTDQISRITGLPPTTIVQIMRAGANGKQISAKTEQKLLSLPIPRSHQDVARTAQGHELLPAIGSRRRLQSLVAIGWPMYQLADRLSISLTGMRNIIYQGKQVKAKHYHEIRALFDELQLQPGPSNGARQLGKRHRWQYPLQWDEDEIDEPDGRPVEKSRRYPSGKRKAVA